VPFIIVFLKKLPENLGIPSEAAENLIKEAANFKLQKTAMSKLIRMMSLNSFL